MNLLLSIILAAAAATCEAQEQESRFRFNGYLTQAYGKTNGVPLLGLDEDGTTDYRTGALLFGFDLSRKDKLVLQLSHEAIGSSPLAALKDDFELDWAFYQRELDSGTRIRVGRAPIPFGIYNELRDVGTLLEFYRPPFAIYFEAAFASETVDGASVSHTFNRDGDWSLEIDAYLGSWDRPELIGADVYEGEAEDAFGAQLWLNTPVEGLRVGLAAQRFDQVGVVPFLRDENSTRFETYLLSVDAVFSRFVFRAEAQQLETSFLNLPEVEIPAFYVLAGYRLTERLAFYAIYEESTSKVSGGPFPPAEATFYDDLAASATYALTPQILVRLEVHDVKTSVADIPLPFGEEPFTATFGILSFSASF